MKKNQALLGLLPLLLMGCATAPQQPLHVDYKQPIHFHVPKTAYLDWEIGMQQTVARGTYIPPNSGLVGAIVATAIDSEERNRRPSDYVFTTYGKAPQSVLMTSLQDALLKNHVFNAVELTVEPKKVPTKATLITVYFKNAHLADADGNIQIILNVDLTIMSSGKAPFKRTYILQSDPGGFFSAKDYYEQEADISQQLLTKIIDGIATWNNSSI
jgi:hypothetical protein